MVVKPDIARHHKTESKPTKYGNTLLMTLSPIQENVFGLNFCLKYVEKYGVALTRSLSALNDVQASSVTDGATAGHTNGQSSKESEESPKEIGEAEFEELGG